MFTHKFGAKALLRDGGRLFGPSDNAVLRNIEACATIADMLKTSLGPNSMKKLIVNHIDKKFVTSDCDTILSELDVQHPAAKVLVMAVQSLQQEFGDGTNTLMSFAGELLNNAAFLLQEGVHISDIRKGYEIAYNKFLELAQDEVVYTLESFYSKDEVYTAIRSSIDAKQISNSEEIGKLVAKAITMIMPPEKKKFDPENVRLVKIFGGSISQSSVLNGIVLMQDASGYVKKTDATKVMVLACGLEFSGPEAKGTVLINNAAELMNFTRGEENQMEDIIRRIKNKNVGCIIANGSVSEMALHFCNKYDILVLKVTSKFELRRLCRSLGATALIKLTEPHEDDLGIVESIRVTEISSKKTTVIHARDCRISTIILKGPTMGILDEIERAIDDGLACVNSAIKDPRFLPGGGAFEIEMARQLNKLSQTIPGLEKYAVAKFAESFECVPKILASNAGHDATLAITELYAGHDSGNKYACVNIDIGSIVANAKELSIFDHYACKLFTMKLVYESVATILSIDQIIMAKPAGGPKPKAPGPPDL
ncbi:chaperonin containing t-complex protein 1, theta subunit, putative [Theileria equi strain WA]|uniref:CCT-theta n=1 Tax=Theileria equi strain WA TaxID=1537102 RepID=L1LGE5_THEEQ|nr:chaperonin containing t-complex protein 1, theta subunit, putative [Theileria equi strain WA]EKX74315.1 chaperonin containing t-complex protein 1, theta subunit, putative [Theileria equi strain WA]|eukprot:XP_004833767.1 chaperonin containing t-complex protein 1, theta subunit, putative [Theileria equi strain WA]